MLYPCKSGWNLPTRSGDMVHTSTFGLKFGSLSPTMTFKIRSRSPNQLFIMSQCYIHANFFVIHPPVHEISCKQESVTPTLTLKLTPTLRRRQQDPHQKQYVLPFGGGHNYGALSVVSKVVRSQSIPFDRDGTKKIRKICVVRPVKEVRSN